MKKIILNTLAALAVCGGLASCSDYLDQTSASALDDSNVFASYDLAKGTIVNIYEYYGQTNYRARHIWYGYNTDIEMYNSTSATRDGKVDLAVYDVSPSNNQLDQTGGADLWSQIYKGVERSNLAIQGLKNYANLEDAKMANLYGEAITLRALAYLDLVNIWGDVPARWEPINSDNQYIARTAKDSIYAHLLDDLKEAETYSALPGAVSETGTVERINKVFVKGLRARVALQAAGYSLHNVNGTASNIVNSVPGYTQQELYKIAYDECTDILANYNTYYKLQTKFQDIFTDLSQDKITNGRESMFEIGYSDTRGRQAYTFANYHTVADGMVNYAKSGGQIGPTPNLYFDYDPSDTRRDVTCINYSWNDKKVQEINNVNKWYFGKIRYEWMKRTVGGTDDGINMMVMRYADIYYMAAEAANELGLGASEVIKYLSPVLTRAYGSASKVNTGMSQEQLRNLIIDERGFEFAGELLRKADLIRWGKLSAKMKEAQTKMTNLRNLQGDYSYLTGRLWMASGTYTFDTGASGRSWSIANGKLSCWGLNPGENDTNVPDGYTEYTNSEGNPTAWIKAQKDGEADDSFTEKIKNLYDPNHDPDSFMYWPIFQYNLNDNYALSNYPWYNK